MIKYIIIGKKWFDGDNIYHTVNIWDINNKFICDIPMTYGYGDSWKQTAYNKLIEMGLVKEKDRFNHKLNHKRFFYYGHDVLRKKDL